MESMSKLAGPGLASLCKWCRGVAFPYPWAAAAALALAFVLGLLSSAALQGRGSEPAAPSLVPQAALAYLAVWPLRQQSACSATPAAAAPQRFVTPVLTGGLGNQLFQASAALAYAWRFKRCVVLPEAIESFHRTSPWPYAYTIFSRLFTDEWGAGPLASTAGAAAHTMKEASAFSHTAFPDSDARLVRLVGYFQHKDYHVQHREQLRGLFGAPRVLRERLLQLYPGLATGVAIHVRRGDYLQHNGIYPIPGADYYRAGVRHVLGALGAAATGTTFFIFSNDWAWVRQEPTFSSSYLAGPVVLVDAEDEVTSLYMMALAERGIVCANSTFCWWAALLGLSTRVTVFPKEWYRKAGVDASGIHIPEANLIDLPF
jgi:hypothetical protein